MKSHTLRNVLRGATSALHDRLDAAMPVDLADPASYARFLQIQYLARGPVEAWLVENANPSDVPPAMTPFLMSDLAELNAAVPPSTWQFEPPVGAAPLGAAWALAGSHLGNRAMLAGPGRPEAGMPVSFLGDATMARYWRELLPRLQGTSDDRAAAGAISAAGAVFERFIAVLFAADCQATA